MIEVTGGERLPDDGSWLLATGDTVVDLSQPEHPARDPDAILRLVARKNPLLLMLARDASPKTVLATARLARERGSNVFVVGRNSSTPAIARAPILDSLLSTSQSPQERASKLALAFERATTGCSRTEELLKPLHRLENLEARLQLLRDATPTGLADDNCACDADAALTIVAAMLFSTPGALAKPIDPRDRAGDGAAPITPRNANELYRALPPSGAVFLPASG